MRSFLLLTALGLALSGCAPQPAVGPMASGAAAAGKSPRQCFNADNINGFRVVNDRTVDLDVGASRVFRAQLFGICPDIVSATGVGVLTRSGGSFVCDDLDLELIVPSIAPTGPRRCPINGLRQLTEAEVQASKQARGRR